MNGMKTAEEIIADATAVEKDATAFLQKQWISRNFVTKTKENALVRDPVDDIDGRIQNAILQEREFLIRAVGEGMADFVATKLRPIEKRLRKLERARREK